MSNGDVRSRHGGLNSQAFQARTSRGTAVKQLSQEDQHKACVEVARCRRAVETDPTPSNKRAYERAVAYVVAHNEGLCILHARRTARRCKSLDWEDLAQWARMGLLRALETFDPERGICFGTYAAYWCRAFVNRSIVNEDAEIRVPVNILDTRKMLARRASEFETREGRAPTVAELALKGGVPVARALKVLSVELAHPTSLDAPLGEDQTRHDVIPARTPSAEDLTVHRETEALVYGMLSELPPREREIIISRFWDEKTLEETGISVGRSGNHASNRRGTGITRERVRQIEQSAMKRLRAMAGAADGAPFSDQ